MKRLLPFVCLLILTVFLTRNSQAQLIGSVTVLTPNPVDCMNTNVQITGSHNCANAVLNPTTFFIAGNIIVIQVNVFQPPICQPALQPYSIFFNLGPVPAGSYTLQVEYLLNGNPAASAAQPLTVGACCSVNSNFSFTGGPFCVGDSVKFTASDPNLVDYDWQIDNVPFDTSNLASYVFTSNGTFNISLTGDDGNCSTTTSQTVTVQGPQVSVSQVVPEGCPGTMNGGIDLQVSGGSAPYSFAWSTGDTTQNISQLSAGGYAVTVTDGSGCTFDDSVTVHGGVAVSAAIQAVGDSLFCLGDSVMLQYFGTGADTLNWYLNGMQFSNLPSSNVVFADSGMQQITAIASNISCSDTASRSFLVSAPFVSNPMITDETCTSSVDGSIDLTVTGRFPGFSFDWSSGDTTQNLSQLAGGTYFLTTTDSLGCMSVDSFVVNTSLGVTAAFNASTGTSVCPGTMVSLINASQLASTFDWLSNGQSFTQTLDASYTFADSGVVEITLIASEGSCVDTTSRIFHINDAPQRNAMIMGESCPESRDGAIDLELIGGSAPFNFLWSTGATTEDIANLSSGTYDVRIQDSANCLTRDTFDIMVLGGAQAAFTAFPVAQGMQFSDLSDSLVVSWHWDFGTGVDTSNLQNPIFDYQASGEYVVCLSTEDLYGCTDMVCDTVSFVLGIDPALYVPLTVSPNPTVDRLQLDLSAVRGQTVQINLFDAVGRLVLSSERIAESDTHLQLHTLSTGVYHLQVNAKEQHFRSKIVKQ